jgi:phosphatidylglycerol:prolipoprotein diacylglycerol transferase
MQNKNIGVSLDDISDIALICVPSAIIGARLYYVLTKLDNYHSFMDMIAVWEGGLAIYGGVIAGAVSFVLVCKFKKKPVLKMCDCAAPGLILGQIIGRWGNFFNAEAYGSATEYGFLGAKFDITSFSENNPLRMGIVNSHMSEYVHPTFLYESLWNLLGVLLVYLYARFLHKKYDGELFIMIFGWYGLGRMFIEGLRTDSLYSEIFGLEFRTSQVLAAVIFAVCLAFYIYFLIKKPNKPFYFREVKKEEKDEKKA